MPQITLPWSMEQDRINQIKANSTHVDDNFNTLLNAVNSKWDIDGSTLPIADQSMNNHKLTNLAAPTANADATTKNYVDTAINNAKSAVLGTSATTTSKGTVQVGSNINVSGGTISVPAATTSALGVVKVGNNISVSSGTISVPAATSSAFGVVKTGSNITNASGTISVPAASTSTAGVITLGRTSTTALANTAAVRQSVLTSTVPTTGADGVIYFVYAA